MSSKSLKKFDDREDILAGLPADLFKNITPRKANFVKEYIRDYNATRATIAAGYATAGAHVTQARLLRDPKIRAVIDAVSHVITKNSAYSIEKAIERQKILIDECRANKQYTAAVKAQEHLNVLTGVYNPRLQLDLNAKGNFIVQVPDFKAPSYAKDELLDVTPLNSLTTGDDNKDGN